MSKNNQNVIAFCDELRAYVEEHHHFPNKHTNLLSRVKYTRKKINEGKLEEWKYYKVELKFIPTFQTQNPHIL